MAFIAVLALAALMPLPAHADGESGPEDALERLLSESTVRPKVRLVGRQPRVRELIGRFPLEKNGRPDEALLSFLERHRAAFGLSEPRAELVASRTQARDGLSRVTFQQTAGGIPVWGRTLEMDVSPDGELVLAVSRVGPVKAVNTEPSITRMTAYNAVKAEWKKHRDVDMPPAGLELVIYNGRLGYDVKVLEGDDVWYFIVDAADGKIVHAQKAANDGAGGCH